MFPYDDNPEFTPLIADYHTQHGLTIAYIKRRVGEGTAYSNEVAKAVVSAEGGYYQLREMPEEFAGALGVGVSHRLVADTEARELLRQVLKLLKGISSGTQTVRSLSLYVIYAGGSLRTRQGIFVFDQRPGEAALSHGSWRPELLPRFFKLRLDAGETLLPPALNLSNGVLFFLVPHNHDDGRCLLATLTRTPAMQDLGQRPAPKMMN